MFGIETCFFMAAAAKKFVAKRGNQDVQETLGGSGFDYISILGGGYVDGTRLQPYVCYLQGKKFMD